MPPPRCCPEKFVLFPQLCLWQPCSPLAAGPPGECCFLRVLQQPFPSPEQSKALPFPRPSSYLKYVLVHTSRGEALPSPMSWFVCSALAEFSVRREKDTGKTHFREV